MAGGEEMEEGWPGLRWRVIVVDGVGGVVAYSRLLVSKSCVLGIEPETHAVRSTVYGAWRTGR